MNFFASELDYYMSCSIMIVFLSIVLLVYRDVQKHKRIQKAQQEWLNSPEAKAYRDRHG